MKQRVARSWEELRSLEGFRGAIDRRELQNAVLVGEYAMPSSTSREPCGINQCRTKHLRGFIIETSENFVSHVGSHCGRKHFGAASWKARLKNFREATRAAARATAIAESVAKAKDLLGSDIPEPHGLASAIQMLRSFDDLPTNLRDSLVAKAQDNDSALSFVRPPTEQEKKQAKFREERVPAQIKVVVGRLNGIRAILSSNRADYIWNQILPEKRRRVEAALQQDEEQVSDAMQQYENYKKKLEESIAMAITFFAEENLIQLAQEPLAKRYSIRSMQIIKEPIFKIVIN